MRNRRVLAAVTAAVFLVCCAAMWFFFLREKGELYALVTVRGEEVMEIPLNPGEDSRTYSLGKFGIPASLETDGERIRFIDVDCPDHICEKTGWLSIAYQSAVCMPNRAVVTVYPRK